MKKWLMWISTGLALAFLGLTVVNFSWLAEPPRGGPKLLAQGGVAQVYVARGEGPQDCNATAIEPPVHQFVENTASSIREAQRLAAQMVAVDVAATADGQIALFADSALDCRTNGSGTPGESTLAQLQALDAGYGYSADAGNSFPLRAVRGNRIPSLEEALAASRYMPILFRFTSNDPADADLLATQLAAEGRDVETLGDSFSGDPAQLARMEEHGGRILVVGPYDSDAPIGGLLLPEQLTEVPASFNGYIWVEDIWTLGPALRPDFDTRRPREQEAADAGLTARRARLEAG